MNPINDNLLRVPNPNYLNSNIERLNELYQCVRKETCSDSSPEQSKFLFIDIYQKTTQQILKKMDFPASSSYTLYPVSSENPSLKLSGPEIYTKNTNTLFEIAEEVSKDCSLEDKTSLFSFLNDAIYMARRADILETEIQSQLDTIENNLADCLIIPSHSSLNPPIINETISETVDEPTPRDSLLKGVIGIGVDYYPQFTALNGNIAGGLKYYLNPDKTSFVQSGFTFALARSLTHHNANDDNLSAQAPYYYLGGGFAFFRDFEIFGNTQWGVINQKHITYYGNSTEPIITSNTKLELDASLGLMYHGFNLSVGGHTSRSFYVGIGYTQSFNIFLKQ